MPSARKYSEHGIPLTVHEDYELCNPSIRGVATQSGKVYLRWSRPGSGRLTLAAFILIGLIFGTSLGYLALAALRAAKSPDDETVPVVATNAPNPSLGDGWEYVSYAARGYSSEEHPKVHSERATSSSLLR